MLRNFKKNHQSGFTIIEVLIVLAIAGLIMVAVFTAVPALQRSSRNNARKSSASQIMASISSYVANNNGNLPSATTLGNALSDYKPGFYQLTDVTFALYSSGPAAPSTDKAILVSGAACNDTNTGIIQGSSSRSYAVWYAVETGSSSTPQCIGS